MTFEEGLEAISALAAWYEEHEGERNEATTRLRLIDTLFFECLGWGKDDVILEEPHGKEYADYVFQAPRRVLIVEAKREGNYFELPAGQTKLEMSLPAIMKSYPNVAAALEQASGYCQKRGVPFGVVTNGHQLIAFIGARSDATAPLEGRALVFGSLNAMRDNFLELWNAISKSGIEEKKLLYKLTTGTRPIPQKLSAVIAPYPGVIERNVVQNELQILSDLILEDIVPSPELEPLFLKECYTRSGALSQFSLASKQLLETRYAAMFSPNKAFPTTVPAVTKNGISQELASIGLARRPILLIGDVGVGKTTFIRNLIKVEAAGVFKKAISIHINLGSQAALATDLNVFVLFEIERQLRENYGIDINKAVFVRRAYGAELKRFESGIYGEFRLHNTELYMQKEIEELERLTQNRSEHIKAALQLILKEQQKQVVIFLDNADQRDERTQEAAFLIAQEISQQWPALVFLSLRPETFNRSQRVGALTGYYAKAFTIAPPRIDEVITKRLVFALKMTRGKFPVARLQNVGIKLDNLTTVLDILYESLRRDDRLFELLDNLSGGNVRDALALLVTFIGSGHVNTRKMLQKFEKMGFYYISPHEFIRAVIYGDSLHFDPSRSAIANLFDVSTPDGKEHFLLPLVIGVLDRKSQSQGKDGFVDTQTIYDTLQSMGFTSDQIDFAVSRGIDKKLIQTSGRQISGASDQLPLSLRVTSAGLYHAHRLAGTFQYIDAMILDTPILTDSVRERVHYVEEIADRLTRAEIFITEYLDELWRGISGQAIGFDWGEMSQRVKEEIQQIRWSLVSKPQRTNARHRRSPRRI